MDKEKPATNKSALLVKHTYAWAKKRLIENPSDPKARAIKLAHELN